MIWKTLYENHSEIMVYEMPKEKKKYRRIAVYQVLLMEKNY